MVSIILTTLLLLTTLTSPSLTHIISLLDVSSDTHCSPTPFHLLDVQLSCRLGEQTPGVIIPPNNTVSAPPVLSSRDKDEYDYINDNNWDTENESESENKLPSPWNGPHLCLGPYCVYSNPSFSSNQGISIITKPSLFPLLSQLAVFSSSSSSKPSSSQRHQHPYPTTSSTPYRIASISNKGLGLISTRPIPPRTSIMSARPVLLIHRPFIDILPETQKRHLLSAAVSALPRGTQIQFLAQMGQKGGEGDAVEDILNTNSFQLNLGESTGNAGGGPGKQKGKGRGDSEADMLYVANFPQASRFNHDCRPNIAYHISPLTLTHHTYSTIPIPEAVELSISYLSPLSVRSVRQARTSREWGFSCTCTQCSLPPAEAEKSDQRLVDIYRLETELEDWSWSSCSSGITRSRDDRRCHVSDTGSNSSNYISKDNNGNGKPIPVPAVLQKLANLRHMYSEERIHTRTAEMHALLALNYNSLGMEAEAVASAMHAIQAGLMERGPEAKVVTTTEGLLRDPRGHWSWRLRLRAI